VGRQDHITPGRPFHTPQRKGDSTIFAAAGMLLICAWSQMIKINVLNCYNASNCQLVILWKWFRYQCHHSKQFSSYRK